MLRSEGIVVDIAGRDVHVDGSHVTLTAREFELLAFMMRHAGRAFRREELLQHVWGFSTGDPSTVTVHMRRLREKVELDPANPAVLVTVWGVGYRFNGATESIADVGRGAPTEPGAHG
jgi:DNA-binding response OmpR family regulator